MTTNTNTAAATILTYAAVSAQQLAVYMSHPCPHFEDDRTACKICRWDDSRFAADAVRLSTETILDCATDYPDTCLAQYRRTQRWLERRASR